MKWRQFLRVACGFPGEEIKISANADVMAGRHYTETSVVPQFGGVAKLAF